MTLIIILLTICITLITVNAFLTHRKLAKLQDELDRERCGRRQLEEFYIQLHKDFAEHYYKYH